MGNLVADAFLWSLITFPDDEKWNAVSIAAINAGTVRASIEQGNCQRCYIFVNRGHLKILLPDLKIWYDVAVYSVSTIC